MATTLEDAAHHCDELLRSEDKDRWLTALFVPEDRRPLIHALYAFNVELARIRSLVREPMLGEIRLQWWEDAVTGIYTGDTPDHPVLQLLARAIAAGDLPLHAFRNMIEARRFDLYDDPMPSMTDLEGYLGETSSALIQLAALVLAGEEALRTATISGYAGVAVGIAGLMRSLPQHRARGQCYVPLDLLARRGLSPAHVLAGRADAAMAVVLAELRHVAESRLREARAAETEMPVAALPAFLPASLAETYLRKLSRVGASVLTEGAPVPQVWRQLRLLRASWAERF
ncbi:MAG: phytoene/squalene synthase family protein [Aestuariivirgaceae bacterium]